MSYRTKKIAQILLLYFVLPIGTFTGIVYYQFGSDGLLFMRILGGVVILMILASLINRPDLTRREVEAIRTRQREEDRAEREEDRALRRQEREEDSRYRQRSSL
jgi:hypothetical protein